VVYETPESHVWDKIVNYGEECYIFNKITGEVRILSGHPGTVPRSNNYIILSEELEKRR
jgi:hypothetical protein